MTREAQQKKLMLIHMDIVQALLNANFAKEKKRIIHLKELLEANNKRLDLLEARDASLEATKEV